MLNYFGMAIDVVESKIERFVVYPMFLTQDQGVSWWPVVTAADRNPWASGFPVDLPPTCVSGVGPGFLCI